MTKEELVSRTAAKHGIPKTVSNEIIDQLFTEVLLATERDERFTVPQFGTFTLKTRKARTVRNPQTNEIMQIPETRTITFKPALQARKYLQETAPKSATAA